MKAKPELGIQFGWCPKAGLQASTSDTSKTISLSNIMIESEGITENVPRNRWRTDIIYKIFRNLPLQRVRSEAADPTVFNWYVREFGVR